MASRASVSQWDFEADVVVLGCGLAGVVTALEARHLDPEADIIILEKMPEHLAGGNSRVSGQSLSFPTDVERYVQYQAALNEPHPIPEPLLLAWADARVGQLDWVDARAREAGFELAIWGEFAVEFPELPGSGCIEALYTLQPSTATATPSTAAGRPRVAGPYPSGVWLCFKTLLDQVPDIQVRYDTPARDLVQDPDSGEVLGVIAGRGDQMVAVKARRGVVMAVGGFEADPQALATYNGYHNVHPYGSPGNTGDGIRMLQKAGAELWHMRNHTETGGNHPGIMTPGLPTPFLRNPKMTAGSWLDLAADDRRFYPEVGEYHDTHFKQKVHGHWRDVPTPQVQPVHMIFDERTRLADCLVSRMLSWSVIVSGYEWSSDNSREVDQGWISKADSLRELAGKCGRDPAAFEREILRYNEFARAGHDPDFGRDPQRMWPIEQPPYYAVRIVPGLICTTGGAKRDEHGRVLDHAGDAIPRLYEAGELGSFHANLYQNGSFLTEAMLSGRWAGASAVSQRAWDKESS